MTTRLKILKRVCNLFWKKKTGNSIASYEAQLESDDFPCLIEDIIPLKNKCNQQLLAYKLFNMLCFGMTHWKFNPLIKTRLNPGQEPKKYYTKCPLCEIKIGNPAIHLLYLCKTTHPHGNRTLIASRKLIVSNHLVKDNSNFKMPIILPSDKLVPGYSKADLWILAMRLVAVKNKDVWKQVEKLEKDESWKPANVLAAFEEDLR